MVGFIEDQDRASPVIRQPVPKWCFVLIIAKRGLADDKALMGGSWIDRVPLSRRRLNRYSRLKMTNVNPKRGLHLAVPLREERCRICDDDTLYRLAHNHFAENEPGLDGLARANIIRDK
jgi:hypothetical protein